MRLASEDKSVTVLHNEPLSTLENIPESSRRLSPQQSNVLIIHTYLATTSLKRETKSAKIRGHQISSLQELPTCTNYCTYV